MGRMPTKNAGWVYVSQGLAVLVRTLPVAWDLRTSPWDLVHGHFLPSGSLLYNGTMWHAAWYFIWIHYWTSICVMNWLSLAEVAHELTLEWDRMFEMTNRAFILILCDAWDKTGGRRTKKAKDAESPRARPALMLTTPLPHTCHPREMPWKLVTSSRKICLILGFPVGYHGDKGWNAGSLCGRWSPEAPTMEWESEIRRGKASKAWVNAWATAVGYWGSTLLGTF